MAKFILHTEGDRERAILLLKKADIKHKHIFELKRQREKRTLSQNKLYWLWLGCISDETGDDTSFLHYYYSNRFLPKTEKLIFEERFEIIKSTTELDTKEFTTYLERIQQHAAEWNCILPLPEERGFEEFYLKYKDYIG